MPNDKDKVIDVNADGSLTKPEKLVKDVVLTYIKYIISSVATIVYLVYIFWGIWTNQAVLPTHPAVHFLLFCFCMLMVAYLEGLQVAILAVVDEDHEPYRLSHPRAYNLMKCAKEGTNVDRFLVGRQFATIFFMTLIGQVTTFPNISNLGIPKAVWFIFIQTGLPAAVVVTTIASLQPQLLAAKDPWLFMDLYGVYSTLKFCHGLEFTGIGTHFAYMLTRFIKSTIFISGKQSSEESKKELSNKEMAIELVKYLVSAGVVMTYLTYLMWGIWTGQAVLPVPPIAVFIILILSGVFLAHLEGIQVAILLSETTDLSPYVDSHPRAYAMMKRATHEKNVRRFLIGRQFFVIFVVYLINQCTIFPTISNLGINYGVWFFFIQLGWPIAINVLCWFQLPTQLLATEDAMMFMNRYLPRTTLEVCLFTEITGLAHFSWVVSGFARLTWFRRKGGDVYKKGEKRELPVDQDVVTDVQHQTI